MDNLYDMMNDYGCSPYNFADPEDILDMIDQYNRVYNIDEGDMKYLSCKDDAGILVIVTNKYVIKIYRPEGYSKLVELYRPLTTSNTFDHIEKIYYYYMIRNGKVIHDTYPDHQLNTPLPGTNIQGVINELLVPIVYMEGGTNRTNIQWSKPLIHKLLIDIADGLDTLHRNGTIHYDSTLDNIGQRPSDSNFVLFDFGFSEINSNDTNMFRNDVNKFLQSFVTHRNIIPVDITRIQTLERIVNTGPYYIGKFKEVILKSMIDYR